MRIIILILLKVFLVAYAQGTVKDTSFYSKTLAATRSLKIYFPPNYNNTTTTRYPVIYYLHCAGCDQHSYELQFFMDSEIKKGNIEPVIIVSPEGRSNLKTISTGWESWSWYTNSVWYGGIEDYIVFDVVGFVDTTYRTLADRNKRFIMGHSMGAYGAMKCALKHVDIFRGAAALSGPLDFNHFPGWFPNQGTSYLTLSLAGAFSPNLNNSPDPIDLPIDKKGTLIDSTFNKWRAHNPSGLVASLPTGTDVALYFNCGTGDDFDFYVFNTGFRDTLEARGLPYVFSSDNGDHFFTYNRFGNALAFIDSTLTSSSMVIRNGEEGKKASVLFYQTKPHQKSANVVIEFVLPQADYITLHIRNLWGDIITTLAGGRFNEGSYTYTWNAPARASGVYFCQLRGTSFDEHKKVLLIE